jgi:hypothetical protein
MKQKKKCTACQWWYAEENDTLCKSCRPLIEHFAKEIKKKYETNTQTEWR